MSHDDQFASDDDVDLFRRWTDCPNDFLNTPPSFASRAYQKLYAENSHERFSRHSSCIYVRVFL
jgi:hypothetical protein